MAELTDDLGRIIGIDDEMMMFFLTDPEAYTMVPEIAGMSYHQQVEFWKELEEKLNWLRNVTWLLPPIIRD